MGSYRFQWVLPDSAIQAYYKTKRNTDHDPLFALLGGALGMILIGTGLVWLIW